MTHSRAALIGVAGLAGWSAVVCAQTPIKPLEIVKTVKTIHVLQVDLPPGVITWSPSRPLAWEDFRGTTPRRLDGALSTLGYAYAVSCQSGQLVGRIVAYFVPEQSWVVPRIVKSGLASRVGIVHEQTHFDLKEVFARRVRQQLSTLTDPCTRSDRELNAIVDATIAEERAEQSRYDRDTSNGSDLDKQEEWNRRTAAELLALKEFAGQDAKSARPHDGK